MPKQVILSPGVYPPIGPYSQAIRVGPLLFVSGLIPVDENGIRVQGGAARETEAVLENLKKVLEAAGATMDHVVKTTLYLTDMDDFKFVNQVYERHFQAAPPARTTVEVAGLPRDARVEIDAIAVIS